MALAEPFASIREWLTTGVFTQWYGRANPATGSMEPPYTDPTGRKGSWPHFHQGIDFVPEDPNAVAPAAGTVTYAGPSKSYGNMVEIQTTTGYKVLMGHFDRVFVSTGQRVTPGQKLAHMGQGKWGASTGPHVHIQVTNSVGQVVDPAPHNRYGEIIDSYFNWFDWTGTPRENPGGDPLNHSLWSGGGYAPPGPIDPNPEPIPITPGGTGKGWDFNSFLASAGTTIFPPLILLGVALVVGIAGVRKLGNEAPVRAVTQPVTQVVDTGRSAMQKTGAVVTRVASVVK